MGRKIKEGLDYFELDCVLNRKFKLLEAEYGLKGFAIIIKLYQKIYSEKGYYCEWQDEDQLLFLNELGATSGADLKLVQTVVSAALKRDIFSEKMCKEYGILTSIRIQEHYFNAVSRRETVKILKEYLLVEVAHLNNIVCKNDISVSRNEKNVGRNTQSREKKSREKKSREKKSRVEESKETEISLNPSETFKFYGTYNNVKLTQEEYDDICQRNAAEYIDKLSVYMAEKNKNYPNPYVTIKKWHAEDERKSLSEFIEKRLGGE